LRASELGDGTLEAREIEDCLEYVELFIKKELLTSMNEAIVEKKIKLEFTMDAKKPFVVHWNVPRKWVNK
jgi:hypothetical protein